MIIVLCGINTSLSTAKSAAAPAAGVARNPRPW
jgi:hypothetical protein